MDSDVVDAYCPLAKAANELNSETKEPAAASKFTAIRDACGIVAVRTECAGCTTDEAIPFKDYTVVNLEGRDVQVRVQDCPNAKSVQGYLDGIYGFESSPNVKAIFETYISLSALGTPKEK